MTLPSPQPPLCYDIRGIIPFLISFGVDTAGHHILQCWVFLCCKLFLRLPSLVYLGAGQAVCRQQIIQLMQLDSNPNFPLCELPLNVRAISVIQHFLLVLPVQSLGGDWWSMNKTPGQVTVRLITHKLVLTYTKPTLSA